MAPNRRVPNVPPSVSMTIGRTAGSEYVLRPHQDSVLFIQGNAVDRSSSYQARG
jgi:hypothetical protein